LPCRTLWYLVEITLTEEQKFARKSLSSSDANILRMRRRKLTFYSRLDCIKLGVIRSNKVRKEVASRIVEKKLHSFTLRLLFHICSCTSWKTHSTLLCTTNQTRSEHRQCVSCSVVEERDDLDTETIERHGYTKTSTTDALKKAMFFLRRSLFRARCSTMCTGHLILELLLEPFIFYFGTPYFHVRCAKEQMLAR
jgi:hypothetical protein